MQGVLLHCVDAVLAGVYLDFLDGAAVALLVAETGEEHVQVCGADGVPVEVGDCDAFGGCLDGLNFCRLVMFAQRPDPGDFIRIGLFGFTALFLLVTTRIALPVEVPFFVVELLAR